MHAPSLVVASGDGSAHAVTTPVKAISSRTGNVVSVYLVEERSNLTTLMFSVTTLVQFTKTRTN